MKELSTEEKAKRYDEALAMAKECITHIPDEAVNKYMLNMFPELKELEDEKIRKELIRAFKSLNSIKVWNGIERTNILAWLEKQGEQKPSWTEDEEKNLNVCLDYIPDDLLKRWLKDIIHIKYDKSADKIESKFNLYDWVVTDKGDTVQIGAVNDGHYTLFNGMDFNMSYADKCWHKWTIKDAKDGDVLYSREHNLLWIYKDKDAYHVATNLNYTHNISIGGDIAIPSDVCPATKEQRDLLFQKMKKEGYEWNKDKKKLIKL